MKVSKRVLLFLAGIVWTAAGFNVLRIGVLAYPPYLSILNFLLSLVVFALFWQFVFGKLVKKHTARILSYPDIPHFFLKFFDRKSFFIMAFMIGGGIALRLSGIAPEQFIAVFYSGLGSSLFLAGILFWFNCQNYHTLLKAQQEKSNS